MMKPQTTRYRAPLLPEKKRLYVGIGNAVVAFNPETGEELWRTTLKRMAAFVTVSFVHQRVFAATSGEIFCLDPVTGEVLWHNAMKGLGYGYVTFAGEEMHGDMTAATAMAGTAAASS